MDYISLRGVRTHNLKQIDLDIPRNKLVVITGPSGSGKSSLAFDTLYAEGQRRYVESLSTYARQFLSMMEKPDLDHVEGLSPAIAIEQRTTSHNPRSTVGTVTEIHDYLRLLFARVGEPRCPTHKQVLRAQSVSQMVDQILAIPGSPRVALLAPLIIDRKGEHQAVFELLRNKGFVRCRVDQRFYELDSLPTLARGKPHTIEAVIDRFRVRPDGGTRLADSIETALSLSEGTAVLAFLDGDDGDLLFSSRLSCAACSFSSPVLEPRCFSFNNPAGACPACDGLGRKTYFDPASIVADDSLSLADGAIRGWDRKNVYYFQMLLSLAEHYGFSVDCPFAELPDTVKDVLLYGSGETLIHFTYLNDRGSEYKRKHGFEGIVPNLERRYRESDSDAVRDRLSEFLRSRECPACLGARLNEVARNVLVDGNTLPELSRLSIANCLDRMSLLQFKGSQALIAEPILREVCSRLGFLINVGLNYLTLDRSADTLSGGEAQRIRLASQIGAGLVGVMYILDEPSIGLHQRDNERLLETLRHLRDGGNSVIVVEHDESAMRTSDYLIDMGPGAGIHGGVVVAQGSLQQIMENPDSLTGKYLSGRARIEVPRQRIAPNWDRRIALVGATANNLKSLSVTIPLGLMTCITGVSGSGKSTLINQTLYPLAARQLNGNTTLVAGACQAISGLELLDRVVEIDQSPIGRTPRSNPATYTAIFSTIRDLFAATVEARSRGYSSGRFSFNVKGGRCEACQGDGVIKVEMHFLPEIYVTCDECKGKRYNRETLEIRYKGRTIHEVLSLTVEAAYEHFEAIPAIERRLKTLMDVGLGYLALGQSATTLSGGEAQRVKLARELSKRSTANTLYILDEPTTGLHFHDVAQLLAVIRDLTAKGGTVVVIEHNLDVIKTADWVIDLGPEGGDQGGEILAQGTPEDIANNALSHTGRFLKQILAA